MQVLYLVRSAHRQDPESWALHRKRLIDRGSSCLFGSKIKEDCHLTTRQYARIVKNWISSIGLDITSYGTISSKPVLSSHCSDGIWHSGDSRLRA
jgi:hypothetical protein